MSLLDWFTRDDAADYVSSIQVLAPDKPLNLPKVKPLRASTHTVRLTDRLARFHSRIDQEQQERIARLR